MFESTYFGNKFFLNDKFCILLCWLNNFFWTSESNDVVDIVNLFSYLELLNFAWASANPLFWFSIGWESSTTPKPNFLHLALIQTRFSSNKRNIYEINDRNFPKILKNHSKYRMLNILFKSALYNFDIIVINYAWYSSR